MVRLFVGSFARSLVGIVVIRYAACGCDKVSCLALGSASIREMEGYRYLPTPVDTNSLHDVSAALSDTSLSDRATPLGRLAFDLARNSHEVWARQRQGDGWRYALH